MPAAITALFPGATVVEIGGGKNPLVSIAEKDKLILLNQEIDAYMNA
jgi:hypothetical protein